MKAERITDTHLYHGEGPVWWPTLSALRYVDMLAGDVMTLHEDGSIARAPVGAAVAAVIRPRRGGGAIVGRERDVALFDDEDLGSPAWVSPAFVPAGQRCNEGGCDPDGRFYVGTMAYQRTSGAASMSRLTPALADQGGADGREPNLESVLTGLTISNGLGWSPDGRFAYFADTPTHTVIRFDYQQHHGELTRAQPFVTVEGSPDGLCVDADGGVWVAINGAGRVHRYDPDGSLDAVVEVGARQTTACTFGGPDYRTLYITTSREGLDEGEDPTAGSLYAIDPGVSGVPPLTFDG